MSKSEQQLKLEEELLGQVVDVGAMEEHRVQLNDFRRRIANGERVPEDELAKAITTIRVLYGCEAEKKKQTKAKAKPKAAKKAPPKVDVDDLLNNLFG